MTAKVQEIELRYTRRALSIPGGNEQILNSLDVERLVRKFWKPGTLDFRESFYVLFLNKANMPLGFMCASAGAVDGTVVDVKHIMVAALKTNATAIIVAHNHPSGQLRPSEADRTLTRKLVRAGEILDIQVLDHLILSSEGFYSFADEGGI